MLPGTGCWFGSATSNKRYPTRMLTRLSAHRCQAASLFTLVGFSTSASAFSPPLLQRRSIAVSTALMSSVPKVLVPIADGSEEIETTCITDTLVRFGADVTVASVMPDELMCKMSRNIYVKADVSISEACQQQDWDLVVLPGGMPGAEHLRDCQPLIELLKKHKADGKLYGAICAAPAVVLASNGLIEEGAAATCYPAPGFREKLPQVSNDNIVVSNNLVTSQGPGTALEFGLTLGELLFSKEKREEIAAQMLL